MKLAKNKNHKIISEIPYWYNAIFGVSYRCGNFIFTGVGLHKTTVQIFRRVVLYCLFFITLLSWTNLPLSKFLCSVDCPQVPLHPVSSSLSSDLDKKMNSVISRKVNKVRRLPWLRMVKNRRTIMVKITEMGIRNRMLVFRVGILEQWEVLLVMRNKNLSVPDSCISAKTIQAWYPLLRFWCWPLVFLQTWLGRVWRVELNWSGREFYSHTSR